MTRDYKSSRRSILKKVGGLSGLAGVSGCLGSITGGGGKIVFGAPTFKGGRYSSLQPPITETIQMTRQAINEAGGIQGRDLEIKLRATASRPQQMRTVMQTFANEDEVKAVVAGGVSGELVPIFEFLKEFEIPIISPYTGSLFFNQHGGDNGTPNDLSDDGWIWRTVGSDTVFAGAAALQCLNNNMTRAGILHSPGTGARSWARGFKNALENGGGKVAKTMEFETGKTSYSAELEELFAAEFDAWLLVGPRVDKTTIVRQWANANYGKQLLLDNNLGQKLLDGIGEAGQGAWICAAAQGGGPNYDEFISRYKEFTDKKPNTFVDNVYDTILPAALALHAADEVSAAAVEKNLGPVSRSNDGGKKVSTYEEGKKALDNGNSINTQGAATNLNFTKYGNVLPPIGVYRVTPSEYKQFGTINLEELREIVDL